MVGLSLVPLAALAVALGVPARAQSAAPGRPITFTSDVAPIIFSKCTSCHRPGEPAPFALMGYSDVRPRGRQIAAVTRARQMPPWKVEHTDFALAGDRRLTDREIETIGSWVADGMPEGDPARLPPLPRFPEGWQLGTPDLVLKMPEAYQVPAAGRDIYRNFVLPLNLDHDVWVKGVEFRPSARAVTHHSLFFLDSTGAARDADAEDAGPGYAGGMGSGVGFGRGRGGRGGRGVNAAALLGGGRGSAAGTTLGGWVPGAQPRLLPDDLAFLVPKGSDLILSTHFHPSGQAQQEASTVGLYFAAGAPTKAFTAIQLPPVFGFLSGINIPAGEAHYSISDSFTIPVAVKAFGVGGHAHYLAKQMTMTATLPDGATKTLIEIADWDFSWQEQYQFANYVDLPAGTRLDVTITYDNSAGNKRNPSSPPKPVRWGEESTDEMGSVSVAVVAANPREMPLLQQALAAHIRQQAEKVPLLRMLMNNGRGRRQP
jgi:hypothetical protein